MLLLLFMQVIFKHLGVVMSHLTYRIAEPEDEPFLFFLYCAVREEETSIWGWSDEQRSHFLQLQFQALTTSYRMQYPNANHKIILHQQAPIGQFITNLTPESLHIIDVSILPHFCNKGYGTELFAMLKQLAKHKNGPLTLFVRQDNRASRLYERLGFVFKHTDSYYTAMEWQSTNTK